jgi:hypothetical protein
VKLIIKFLDKILKVNIKFNRKNNMALPTNRQSVTQTNQNTDNIEINGKAIGNLKTDGVTPDSYLEITVGNSDKINNVLAKAKKSVDITQMITIDEFIEVWNNKITEIYNKEIKNNVYENVVSNYDATHVIFDTSRLNGVFNDFARIKIFDNIEFTKRIKNIFIFKDLLIFITNEIIYYINLETIVSLNSNIILDNIEVFKSLPLVGVETKLNVIDILFENDYFVVVGEKSHTMITYNDSNLEIQETITSIKYQSVDVTLFDDVILNTISESKNMFQIGYYTKDEFNNEKWNIKNFNKNILSLFNLSISNVFTDREFDIESLMYFNISEYTENYKSFQFIYQNLTDYLLYNCNFVCDDDNITNNVKITNLSFIFNDYLLTGIKTLNNQITIETDDVSTVYFIYNNFLWKMILDGEDSKIQRLFSITESNFIMKKYFDTLIIHTENSTYNVKGEDYVCINTPVNSINVNFVVTPNNVITITPLVAFAEKNRSGYILNTSDNIMFFYKQLDSINYNAILNETDNMIGFYDRLNNYVRFKS